MKIITIILFIAYTIYAIGGFWFVPSYEKNLMQMDVNLPAATRLLLDSYQYWIVLAIIPLIAYFALHKHKKLLALILYPLLGLALVFIPLVMSVMNLPV